MPALDRVFASIDFSFMATCPVDFDCRHGMIARRGRCRIYCSTTRPRTTQASGNCCLICCRSSTPNFTETNPSDLGIALVELLAYAGDRLSYFQDAVANEAYLDTLRHRISARRLAKLDRLPDA